MEPHTIGQIWNQCKWHSISRAGEITQVIDSIPWVRCASGNVLSLDLTWKLDVHLCISLCFQSFPVEREQREFWSVGKVCLLESWSEWLWSPIEKLAERWRGQIGSIPDHFHITGKYTSNRTVLSQLYHLAAHWCSSSVHLGGRRDLEWKDWRRGEEAWRRRRRRIGRDLEGRRVSEAPR